MLNNPNKAVLLGCVLNLKMMFMLDKMVFALDKSQLPVAGY